MSKEDAKGCVRGFKMKKNERIKHGCLGIHSEVDGLGLRVVMRLNNKSIKIETFK